MIFDRKKTRVLFLFAHLHKGGMQRAVSNISQALPVGFEQFVGFFGTENPPFEYCATLYDFNVPGSLRLSTFARIKNFFLRLYKLRNFVRKHQIDVVVSLGETANLLNLLSFNSARRVLTVRSAIGGYGDNGLYGRIYPWIIRFLYPFSDEIVAVSEDLKEQVEKLTGGAISVCQIPNLYHLEKIISLSEESLPPEVSCLANSQFILNVGSLVGGKGQDLLIRAFASISHFFPALMLVFIGRGPDKNRYVSEAESLGVGGRVLFIEFDPNPYRYMRHATVFVLPSLTEGFPNVMVEAMACACPVVAFDCPTGPREILGVSEYGDLVQEMTAEALAKKLYKLLSSKDRLAYLKKQATTRATHYDANRVIEQWVNVLSRHC